jgi:hypothetical protein
MSFFIENGLAIAVIGGLATTLALVFFMARRTGGSLGGLAAAVGATLVLLAIEWFVQSDREQIESAAERVYGAVEANDVNDVLAVIDPAATTMRSDVQTLMPLMKVEKARTLGTMKITIDDTTNPPTAVSSSKAYLDGVHGKSGARVAYFNQQVDLKWVKRGDQWLLDGYTPYYEGKPIDAVNSARTNRAVP